MHIDDEVVVVIVLDMVEHLLDDDEHDEDVQMGQVQQHQHRAEAEDEVLDILIIHAHPTEHDEYLY